MPRARGEWDGKGNGTGGGEVRGEKEGASPTKYICLEPSRPAEMR